MLNNNISILKSLSLLGLSVSFLILANSAQAADVAKGERLYRACKVCHSVEAGVNKMGPSLHNIIGHKAAAIEGYRYSAAMKAYGEAGNVWTVESLDTFLTSPRKAVPRTKMAYGGMRKPQDRENLLAYLSSLSAGSK